MELFVSFIFVSTNYSFFIDLHPGVEASSENSLLSNQSNLSESEFKFIHKQSLRGIFFVLNENNENKHRLTFSKTFSFSSFRFYYMPSLNQWENIICDTNC